MSQWTEEKVIDRLEECAWVLNSLPSGGGSEYASYWPEILYTPKEIQRQPPRRLRVRPLPDAIDRMEATLQWIPWIEEPHRPLIWLRAYRVPWRGVARETGLSPTTARRHWEKAIQAIAERLTMIKRDEGA